MLLKTLTPAARAKKKKKSKVICQARYFHIAFLNQKTLWKEVTATVTESVSLRYNMRGFTPALIPASAMKFKSSSTSCAQQRPPQHRLGAPLVPLVLLLVQLGRALTSPVPTKAQLLHWCCQLQAIQTGPITDQSVSGENGLLSSQITQIQGILQLFGFWAHIPELLVPLMMWSLPGETSAVFHLMVYLSSTIQIPPPSTTHSRGSSTSALCWAPALLENTTSVLPGGETQENTEKNLKSLGNQGFASQMP